MLKNRKLLLFKWFNSEASKNLLIMETKILLFCLFLAGSISAQKLGNITNQVSNLALDPMAARMQDQVDELPGYQPLGINQFRNDNTADFKPIYFEVYPFTASTWLGCDFPAERNIQFIRIMNVIGQIVATYHPWDRQFYVGHLQSGFYQVQLVQRDFQVHSATFYKR